MTLARSTLEKEDIQKTVEKTTDEIVKEKFTEEISFKNEDSDDNEDDENYALKPKTKKFRRGTADIPTSSKAVIKAASSTAIASFCCAQSS